METLSQTVAGLAAIAMAIYGLLLVVGAPFDKSPQLANSFVRWLTYLPFRLLFGKKKKRKRKKQGR